MFLERNRVNKAPPSGPSHCQATYPSGHETLLQDCLHTRTWQKWAGMTWQIVTRSMCTTSPVFVSRGVLRAWVEL